MWKFSDFFHQILQPNKVDFNIDNKKGTTTVSGNKVANIIYETNYFINLGSSKFEEKYESVISNDSSTKLREIIFPIESLIAEGRFSLAIYKYEELIDSPIFDLYTKDEKFLIYNGLLNCHINNNSNNDIIEHWIVKIEALGTDIKEIHRFYFLQAIWKYKNHEFNNALILIAQSLNANPEYMNAITTEILFKCNNGQMLYSEAKIQLKELFKLPNLSIKDIATIYSSFGDVSFDNKDYSIAKENYIKSNELSRSLTKEIVIAICEYYEAFKDVKDDGHVNFENIDFDILNSSKDRLDTIYKNRTPDTIHTIVKISFNFFFSILTITNNFSKILSLYSETKEYFNSDMNEAIKFVVEAEVATGVLTKEILESFEEYDQIKYEALYLDVIKSYQEEIDLLLPAIEGKYKNDIILQFSLLNALKETNQFERYMEYYKRFSGHQDDIMRMNYIQFLLQIDKKEQAFNEIEKFKSVMKKSSVLYDLLVIYLEFNKEKELDDFFKKVDSGEYKVIGLHKPFVFYNKMMHLLNNKKYQEYFKLYETTDMSFLNYNNRIVLKINYYIFKGNNDEIAASYYELFQFSGNHNELLKAVQIKLDINKYHEAEFYLQFVNPMELEKPEIYYMFKAIILKENGNLEEAFNVLIETAKLVSEDLESPFHQFYAAFNMNNGRTDDAVIYMNEYYSKNPNPNWFKVIKFSENETGLEILKKFEDAVGGKRDLSLLNRSFSKGIIGLSTYSHITGIAVEDILYFNHYPYTKVHVSNGHINKAMSDVDLFNTRLLIDSATLTLLSEANSLNLLDIFDEIYIPYSTLKILNKKESGIFNKNLKPVLDYIKNSPYVKNIPIDEGLKIKENYTELITEDILDCISLSENLNVPFLNSEVVVNTEFKSNYIVDMNAFFFYLKKNKQALREQVAEAIGRMRKLNFEFLSFDSDDMFIEYSKLGLEGIGPFLKIGINADYKTFNHVYIGFLARVKSEKSIEEFELCSIEIIHFMDKYVGKTRYYMSCIILNHPVVKDDFENLIRKPSVKNILLKNKSYNINALTAFDYMEIIESYEFQKIINISSSFVVFIIQFISLVKDNELERTKYINLIKHNISVNSSEDIDYILHNLTKVIEEKADVM